MTAATVSSNGQSPNTSELRAAARAAYRASLTEGVPSSGAALGRQFDMSERWGRDRVTEVQREPTPTPDEALPRSAEPEPTPPTSGGSAAAPAEATAEQGEPAADDGSWVDSLIILAVAGVAAVASYGHMLEVAIWAGEPLWIARAFPITVDGLVLAALRRGRPGRWWLALGVAVSVAANMLSRYPDLAATAGPVISAWPPLALFGTHRLLHARKSAR